MSDAGGALDDVSFGFVDAAGVRLHVATAGPPDGPMTLLLHGFPEFWYGWRYQIPALARAGFFVVAADQRGYNRSDVPRGARSYRLDLLAADAASLIAAYGRDEAAVIGHDFGAAVSWRLAMSAPERVRKLVAINVPHPRTMTRALRTDPWQLMRSWYIGFFQLPVVPEVTLARSDHAALVAALRRTSRPGTFTDADIARYREAWSMPDAIRGMLSWYRALPLSLDLVTSATPVQPPTLVIWGDRDVALVPELADASLDHCADGRLERFPEASHWVQHEEAERVSELLVSFL